MTCREARRCENPDLAWEEDLLATLMSGLAMQPNERMNHFVGE